MPSLHRFADRPGYFIRGISHGQPVTFELTAEGEQYLLETLGLHDGSKFTRETLRWLYRKKWVLSLQKAPAVAETATTPPPTDTPVPSAEAATYEDNPVVYPGVVQIRLSSADQTLLDEAVREVIRILAGTQVAVAGPIPLPVHIEPYVVLRDGGRQVYELRRYERLLQVRQPRRLTVEAMNQFALPREVDVQVQMA
jgi:small subunit ribosomal protein S10